MLFRSEGQDIMIDSEKLKITTINGQQLTVSRAVPPTTAGTHPDETNILVLDDAVVVVGSPNGVTAAATLADLVVPCP